MNDVIDRESLRTGFVNSQYKSKEVLDSNIVIDAVRVTEAAAISAARLIGRGDENAADQVAVDAMRRSLGKMNIDGTIVIGEGERDKAPMLYVGEKVGTGHGPKVDIALDPLEGTTICATAGANSLSVIAMTEDGGLLNAPDVYMEKIAVGIKHGEQIVDLDNSPKANLLNLAKIKNCDVEDLVVVILQRDRHEELIANVREAGARVKLIRDGDVAAVIGTALGDADMYIGTGGAPEGVLAAAALSTTGGQMMGRLLFDSEEQKTRAKLFGINDFNKKYLVRDMAKGEDVMFAATGVTDGNMLRGIRVEEGKHIRTNSVAMSSKYKTIRYIKTLHPIE